MKKLYKATYHTVIYADGEDEAISITEAYIEDGDLFVEPSSLSEIRTLDDLPPVWERDHYPVKNKCGDIHSEDTIEEILNKRTNSSLQEEIKALKQRLEELEKQINK
jgi:polyhydroxyalkanoate synthesis regulator phasin